MTCARYQDFAQIAVLSGNHFPWRNLTAHLFGVNQPI